MPSIVTHHLFAKDLLNRNIPKNFDLKTFYIFAQSFDNLFYYHFFIPFKGHTIRNLGNIAQNTNTNLYFKNIINYLTKTHNQHNKQLLAYLYGSYCHYALDSIVHPYIIYTSGLSSKNSKYRGGHEKMEVMIDALLYKEKTNQDLKDASLANTLLPKVKFSKTLKDALNEVYKKTFQIDNIGHIYEKSYLTGHFIIKYFVTDHTGIKKKIYHIIDHFKTAKMYEYLSFYLPTLDYSVLNEENNIWYNPTSKKISSHASFYQLYNEALDKVESWIKLTNDYFANLISIETLLEALGNNSYRTGRDVNIHDEMQYFKY